MVKKKTSFVTVKFVEDVTQEQENTSEKCLKNSLASKDYNENVHIEYIDREI